MGILILLFFFFPDRALILKIKKVNGLNFTWPSVNLSIFRVLTRVNRRLFPYAYSSQIDLSEKINLLKIWSRCPSHSNSKYLDRLSLFKK